MLKLEDMRALAQVIDTTWGQSSTDASPTMSVKMNMSTPEEAIVTYTTVITHQGRITDAYAGNEYKLAQEAIDAYLKDVKKGYKELTGKPLKLKLIDLEPTVEPIDVNTFSPLRAVYTSYYRCVGLIDVG